MREVLLTRFILQACQMADGYATPEESLRTHVGGLLRPAPTDEEWQERIKALEDDNHIVRMPHSFNKKLIQWAITERGRVALATL